MGFCGNPAGFFFSNFNNAVQYVGFVVDYAPPKLNECHIQVFVSNKTESGIIPHFDWLLATCIEGQIIMY